jgi:NitT/TauT family transport system ATP-binding protein
MSAASAAEAALALQEVACQFRAAARDAPPYTAISHTSLHVAPGEFLSVVGPTGCGKSTLLNLAAGLLQPSLGTVRVFGQPLAGLNRRAGYLFQSDALMPWRTALQNIVLGLEYRGIGEPQRSQIGTQWLRRVGLAGYGDRYPHQLSGGMRKRVALAQTLVLDPDLILMDEPFSALDIQTRALMENELLALWQERRKAVLFITHDLDEAIALSDRVLVLSAGPGTHPIGEFAVDIPRPRDVAEIRSDPRFVALHAQIWSMLREQVLRAHGLDQAVGR